jgi:hypothetical protein
MSERLAAGQVPEVAGILTADQVRATGLSIATAQQPDGSIGWPDGHVDAWNHVECAMALSLSGLRDEARRAYAWLASEQRPDGSWLVTPPTNPAAKPEPFAFVPPGAGDGSCESNHAAYVAVGVWHELLHTSDDEFAEEMWPVVRAAIEFALGLQTTRGEIIWRRNADGTAGNYALLTGSSSMHQSLRCAIALAEYLGQAQPDWELAADRLGHVVACHGEAFADKSWFSMDWYYPVLGGAVRGAAASRLLAADWDTFVVPGLGVRCVSNQPWVTGAETCELAIALDAIGDSAGALELFGQVQHLRAADGAYWTGWQYANGTHFPHEQSSWTAAAVVLAADVLADASDTAGLFKAAGRPEPADATACGCQPS